MYKILKATKDAYITDRVVKSERSYASNTGEASTLDIFKLYGITTSGSTPNIELSRALIKFDLEPIRTMITDGKIDISNSSFSCKLKLFDVDGGQTVPSNFTLCVNPLSRSFDEGLGRDVVLYEDYDVCNFLTGSREQGPWVLSGANSGGHNSENVDYLTTFSALSSSLQASQLFVKGTEDLNIDVTTIVSATLSNQIPDEGFRLSLTSSLETNTRTYFVKRFASRHAYDESYHPQLVFTFDDSIQDDSAELHVGETNTMFLWNYKNGTPSLIQSASSDVTTLKLKLQTPISGGFATYSFSGSQHLIGAVPVVGAYSASVLIPENDSVIIDKLQVSGSIRFTTIWGSNDGTIGFLTGTSYMFKPQRGGGQFTNNVSVHVTNVEKEYTADVEAIFKVTVFDAFSSNHIISKVPIKSAGLIVRDLFYQIRDANTDKIIIPFDTIYNSTKISSDIDGMFFKLDTSNLINKRSYVVDILYKTNGQHKIYKNASSIFNISDVT